MNFLIKLLYPFLVSILLIFFLFTRFFKITEIPNSLYWDEASIGYNAYSVLTTGKDEWGETLPIHFRAFGEFKLPVYIYSVALATKLFGFSEFSVRLPAVIYSFGFLLITCVSISKLFRNKWLGLLSLFFLTITPWFFIFSRTGYEAVAGLFFYSVSFYLFLSAKSNKKYFIFSTVALLFSFYSYNSFRILSPLTFLLYSSYFLYLNKSKLKNNLFVIIFSSALFLTSLFPVYKLISQDFGLLRLDAVQEKSTKKIFANYLSHFSFNFLISKGDTNPRSHFQGAGQLWLLDIPLVLFGIFFTIRGKEKMTGLIFLLFLISFIPSAITKEAPHSLRSLPVLFSTVFLWTYGIKNIFNNFKKVAVFILPVILAVNFLFFLNYFSNFIKNYNYQNSQHWQIPYKKIFTNYNNQISNANKVIVTDKFAQPYIFALFYLKYDPYKFQTFKSVNDPDKWGVSLISSLGKFEFREPTLADMVAGNLIFSSVKLGKEDDLISLDDGQGIIYVYFN